jgi:hypothetical protein
MTLLPTKTEIALHANYVREGGIDTHRFFFEICALRNLTGLRLKTRLLTSKHGQFADKLFGIYLTNQPGQKWTGPLSQIKKVIK